MNLARLTNRACALAIQIDARLSLAARPGRALEGVAAAVEPSADGQLLVTITAMTPDDFQPAALAEGRMAFSLAGAHRFAAVRRIAETTSAERTQAAQARTIPVVCRFGPRVMADARAVADGWRPLQRSA